MNNNPQANNANVPPDVIAENIEKLRSLIRCRVQPSIVVEFLEQHPELAEYMKPNGKTLLHIALEESKYVSLHFIEALVRLQRENVTVR